MLCGREKYRLCLKLAHLVDSFFLTVAQKALKCAVIMKRETNFVLNKAEKGKKCLLMYIRKEKPLTLV